MYTASLGLYTVLCVILIILIGESSEVLAIIFKKLDTVTVGVFCFLY